MDKLIHAHVLMDFIEENPKISTLQELKTKFKNQFGEVKFTNCTNNVYDLEEIYEFLAQRKKVRHNSEGIEVIKEHRCDQE